MSNSIHIRPHYFTVSLDGKYAEFVEDGHVKVIIDGAPRLIEDLRDFEFAVSKTYDDEPEINIINRGLSRIEGTRGIKRIRVR